MKNIAFLAALLCVSFGFVRAQTLPIEPAAFSPEIKRLAVFKNGYAFTYREGEARPVSSSGGWVYTTRTPIGGPGSMRTKHAAVPKRYR